MTLYFAYGSNLSLTQMQQRCPAAVPLDSFMLPDARLVFRGVADVVFERGAVCPGGLWSITPACERTLDEYEGIARGTYRKLHVEADGLPDGETHVMMYVMNSTGIMPPSLRYYGVIRDGYLDFGLPLHELRQALKHAHDHRHLTHIERQRLRRNGRPPEKPRPVPVKAKAKGKAVAVRKVGNTPTEWEAKREAAKAAERHSRALKRRSPEDVSPEWKDRVAKATRMNTLAEWLAEERKWGRMT